MFNSIFENMPILITGHTGFKGSWLTHWLRMLNAKPIGFSLSEKTPSNYTALNLHHQIPEVFADIRDYDAIKNTIDTYKPELVFHLAAQPIVLESFQNPKDTFDINVGGTVNILEAIRTSSCVKAAVIVTTDKCYENKNWLWSYRESDVLGGTDPYSASKCMAEHATASYRTAFFSENHAPAIASARAGNVIGGGDFSPYRIIPDCIRALSIHQPIQVRNPKSTRPWLYVLDAIHGYLTLAKHLLADGHAFAEAWNFAPLEQKNVSVEEVVEEIISAWGSGDWMHTPTPSKEMHLLKLNGEKAAEKLGWRPTYTWQQAIEATVEWHLHYNKGQSMEAFATHQINAKQEGKHYALSPDSL